VRGFSVLPDTGFAGCVGRAGHQAGSQWETAGRSIQAVVCSPWRHRRHRHDRGAGGLDEAGRGEYNVLSVVRR
jgi:hypothetical protein